MSKIKHSGDVVLPEDVVEEVLSAHDDLYVKPGPAKGGRRQGTTASQPAGGASAKGGAGGFIRISIHRWGPCLWG